jgi:hypothetical protein
MPAMMTASRLHGWFLWVAAALMLAATPVLGQNGDDPPAAVEAVAPEFATPRATMQTFLGAMGGESPDLDRAVECMDISKITRDGAPETARKLHRCLNRIQVVDVSRIAVGRDETTWTLLPRDRPPRGSRLEQVQRLAPDARIDLVKGTDGAWRFSADTVAGTEGLYTSRRRSRRSSKGGGRRRSSRTASSA